MAATEIDPYERFTRADWAALRASMPLHLSSDELMRLRGTNDQVSLVEVVEVYLPLARLLNFHIAAAHALNQVQDAFLGRPAPRPAYIIAVTGSVAVGKTTLSRVLQAVLSRAPGHPKVDIVTTDGFLYPNAVLESRGLMNRKGFPESYDLRRMLGFLAEVKLGRNAADAPVYSHHVYDIVPGAVQVVDRPEILVLEGLNLLQVSTVGGKRIANIFASDMIDFSIFVDADENHIRDWYIDRFMLLKGTAFQAPDSYFHRYSHLSEAEARAFAERVWAEINLVNLRDNVLPTRERAHVVLRKAADHAVGEVWLRRL